MIAYLQGKILEKSTNFIILYVGAGSASGGENSGTGYKVFVTPEVLESRIGDTLSLYIYHKVSEDGQSLFGLPDFNTLQFFEMLITVSGVGPKVALAILSSARVDAVKSAIANQDAGIFTRISGVGTKTAEKIIVELKGKLSVVSGQLSVGSSEVFDALLALGYKQAEVRGIINKLDASATTGEQIKQALKLLGK
jgi:Holliday junction DNA helicase RuvA